MTTPLPLGFPQLFQRLGLLRTQLPPLANDIMPVVIYADWSRSLASEVFEARAQTSFESVAIPVGGSAGIGLEARSAGGLVVEQLFAFLRPQVPGAETPHNLFLAIQEADFGAEPTNPRVDLGGIATVARPFTFFDPIGAPPGHDFAAWPVRQDVVQEFGARIWVPSGSAFFVTVTDIVNATFAQVALIWRELAGHQGAG